METMKAPYSAGDELGPAGPRIVSVERIGGGGNSRVFLVTCDDRRRYAVKRYSGPTMEGRDRLDVEFSALSFLWENRVRRVPRPVAKDMYLHLGVYEFVEGSPVAETLDNVDGAGQAISFIEELKSLRHAARSRWRFPAAEACFSLSDVLDNIRSRFKRLNSVCGSGREYAELKKFLDGKMAQAFLRARAWAEPAMAEAGLRVDETLPEAARTLSPSDFGFHNAITRPGGQMVFVDFEYFGWDDPAKMISDFLLHPAMSLDGGTKRRFAEGIFNIFGEDKGLRARFSAMFPLFGMKWAAITLNEFLPGHHRNGGEEGADARLRKLARAEALVDDIMKNPGPPAYL